MHRETTEGGWGFPFDYIWLRSFVREVRVIGNEVLLTYTMPFPPEKNSPANSNLVEAGGGFFIPLNMVEIGGTIGRTFKMMFNLV